MPLWTTNKAFALAGIALICASFLPGPNAKSRCWLGMLGYSLAAIHTFASLILFSPVAYPKFYDTDDTLNLIGQISMLGGVLSLACFTVSAVTSLAGIRDALSAENWRKWQRIGALGLTTALIHVAVMAIPSLSMVSGWFPLPSITLIGTALLMVTLLYRVFGRKST